MEIQLDIDGIEKVLLIEGRIIVSFDSSSMAVDWTEYTENEFERFHSPCTFCRGYGEDCRVVRAERLSAWADYAMDIEKSIPKTDVMCENCAELAEAAVQTAAERHPKKFAAAGI